MKYEFLPHTADARIKIYGENIEEIIKNSLLALKDFWEAETIKEEFKKEIEVDGDNQVELLINFLSEVLAQTYIEKTIFVSFTGEISERKIKGKISGYKFKKLKKDIKAITYHQTKLEKINNKLTFEFIIDI